MSNQLLLRRRTMLGQSKEVAIHGIPPISITGKRNLLSVKAFGECVQNGTPTPDNPVDIVCNNGVLKVDNQGNVYTYGNVETITITPGSSAATTEMLLKVGDYQDVQSIIDGVVTRNVGTLVLDGTEEWSVQPYYTSVFASTNDNINGITTKDTPCICTLYKGVAPKISVGNMQNNETKCGYNNNTNKNRFYVRDDRFTTVDDFKQWLADQYNAGTPVIVIYPVATPTTEQVVGQTLVLTSSTNIIDITQASLQGLELEVLLNKT